jgi:hypothetical protein
MTSWCRCHVLEVLTSVEDVYRQLRTKHADNNSPDTEIRITCELTNRAASDLSDVTFSGKAKGRLSIFRRKRIGVAFG